MRRNERLLSAFLAWHIVAMFVGAIPDPSVDPLPPIPLPRDVHDDVLASRVAPVLDSAVEGFVHVPVVLNRLLRPVRPAVDFYLGMLNLQQRWSMFASPPQADQYLRLRYFVAPVLAGDRLSRPTWTASELVMPAHDETQVRLWHSYLDSSRDKAIGSALDEYHRAMSSMMDRGGRVPDPLPLDLAPVGRYFAREFARRQLGPNERIVWVETWYGEALNPPPGHALAAETLSAREKVLEKYYEGPVRAPAVTVGRYGAREHEADINWLLDYVEPR